MVNGLHRIHRMLNVLQGWVDVCVCVSIGRAQSWCMSQL